MKKLRSINSVKDTLAISRRLLGVLWYEDKKIFAGMTVSVLVPAAFPFVNAFIYALIINFIVSVISGHHHSYERLYILILIRVLMLFVQDIAFTLQYRYNAIFTSRVPLIFSQAIIKQLARLDIPLIEDGDFQNKFQSARESSTWRPTEMLNNIFYSMQSILTVVIAAGSLFFLNWIFGVIILITALPTFFYQANNAKNIWYIWANNSPFRKRFNYLYYKLQDPRSAKELKLFRLAGHFAKRSDEIGKKFFSENLEALNKRFKLGVLSNLVNVLGYAAVEIYIFLTALARHLSLGGLTYYTTALINFQSGINGLFRSATVVFDDSQYVKGIFELLDLEPSIVSPPNAKKLKTNSPPIIEFKNVSFTYLGSKTKVLNDFSLIINPGEKIAFVGENGAGKTTIVKLLCRFYDVDEGEILINGVNIKQLELKSWYECIGVIFQDFLKYEYSLKENILFGQINKPEIMSLINDAAEKAGADDVKKSLPKGYEQMLGNTFEESIELSTGQWQKVALARGFYRNAPVLILDEPTSAIDARAEHEIFRKVEKLTKEKTAIIISHRFSTVRNADKIYVIENGKIIESGSHDKLMKLNGVYADLFSLQAEAYK